MTTKIATSFGLALMLAMGVLATMLALGVFTGSKVNADDAAPTMVARPDEAGVLAEYKFTFTVTGSMTSGNGEIRITFDESTQLPATISRNNVLVTASRLSNNSATGTVGATGSAQVVPLQFDPIIETFAADPARKTVIIKVPDMNPSTADPGIGAQGFGVGYGVNGGMFTADTLANIGGATQAGHTLFSNVTVTFTTAAGLKNASEQETSRANVVALDTTLWSANTNLITGDAVTSTADDPSKILNVSDVIQSTLTLSSINGSRGSSVTATGRGFNDKTTATIFLDSDADGIRDAGEIDLGSAVVGSDDTFTVTFSVTAPPFIPGKNKIGAVDGELRKITQKDADGNVALGSFELRGSMTVIPSTAAVGDTIQLQLKDFDKGCDLTLAASTFCTGGTLGDYTAVPSITVGGVNFTKSKFSGTTTTDSTTGEATFTAVIPDGVAIGAQTLRIGNACCLKGGGEASTRSSILTISGAVLTLTPATAVPNQTLTVIGRSYTGSDKINDGADNSQISISGSTNRLKAKAATGDNNVNEGNKISIDAGGNWSASIVIPINTTTTTPGTHEFKVTDHTGREGVTTLTIAPRTVTISPVESRVGTTVTMTGKGFPADNTGKTGAASTPSVEIKYVGTTTITVATITPDASGNFTTTFKVPLDAGIPSTNTIRAEFKDEGGTLVTTGVVHDVPRAELTVSPASGPPGTKMIVKGNGFKGFSTVSELKLGANDVRPAPVPSTDDVGNFSAEILVPQLNTGSQTVTATAGGTTASASFTVTVAPPPPPPPAPVETVAPATGLAPLGTNLVRTWGYDAATQKFQLYDPAAALLSDLTALKKGGGYWINVTSAQTVTLGTGSYSLSAGWNLIGWLG